MTIQILIVDDEQPIRESLSGLFEDEGYLVSTSASGEEAVVRFRKSPVDCVFLDIWMPGIDGLETMSRIKQINPDVPIIMMSGHATIDTAVRATKLGAFDFIEKPFSLEKLLITLRNAVEKRRLELENSDLKLESKQLCPRFLGASKAVQTLCRKLDKVKSNDKPVLLSGDHGTGKSIAAKIIHEDSSRSEAPFMKFSAIGMDEAGIEAELYGYEKGAFAGAMQAHRGRLEAAHLGVLYIEEIADVPMLVQQKLLEVTQQHRIQRLGNQSHLPCDIRLVIGSKHTKANLLSEGKIIKDLCAQVVEMPTLQQRSNDIPALLERLTHEQAKHLGGAPVVFDDDAVEALKAYVWPGNVRELRNYIERTHMLYEGQNITFETMLPLDLDATQINKFSAVPDDSVLLDGFHDARKRFECSYILHHLDKNDWNISKTATDIGMERSQLHRKIKSHELTPPHK